VTQEICRDRRALSLPGRSQSRHSSASKPRRGRNTGHRGPNPRNEQGSEGWQPFRQAQGPEPAEGEGKRSERKTQRRTTPGSSRRGVSKGEKTCGTTTRPNAASGARRCWSARPPCDLPCPFRLLDGTGTSDTPAQPRSGKWMAGSVAVCGRSCASGAEARGGVEDSTINAGATATLPNSDSCACKGSEHRNGQSPQRSKRADQKAGCGKTARPVWREGPGVASRLLPQSWVRLRRLLVFA
jgi:hypothetical protein